MSKTDTKWSPTDDKIQDQRTSYDAMRRQCPVAHTGDHTWWIFRHKDITRILEDHETFSNEVSAHASVPNGMDPPEHTTFRNLIESYFSTGSIKKYEQEFRSTAEELVNEAQKSGQTEAMADIALPYAARVQCAFLGWADSLAEPLIRWTQSNRQAVRNGDRARLSRLADEFRKLVDNIIEERERAEAAFPVTVTDSLLREEVDGRRLTRKELTSIFRNWTVGEVGSIAASIGIILHYLAYHPALWDKLRDSPSLLTKAIDEILRLHGPLVANRRKATRPATLDGKTVKKGDMLYLNWISANRDEEVFEQPETVRLDRNPGKNLLYGKGIHKCPGAPLARMELSIFMEELLNRTDAIEPGPDSKPQKAQYPASGFSLLPLVVK